MVKDVKRKKIKFREAYGLPHAIGAHMGWE
jgi:hypothetical protein